MKQKSLPSAQPVGARRLLSSLCPPTLVRCCDDKSRPVHSERVISSRRAVVLSFFCCLGFLQIISAPASIHEWASVRAAESFDRNFLPDPTSVEKIRASGSLAGAPHDCCITGWVDYDFSVPAAGWYELGVMGSGLATEYIVNPDPAAGKTYWYQYDSSGSVVGEIDKIGNFWLEEGRNTIRIQRYFWTGLPRVTKVVLRSSDSSPSKTTRAALSGQTSVFRAGDCAPLTLYTEGRPAPTTIMIKIRDASGRIEINREVTFPASKGLQARSIPLPCNDEGDFLVIFGEAAQGWFPWRDVRGISYEVIARATPDQSTNSATRVLLQEIDAAHTLPDYLGGGETRAVRGPAGQYLESGTTGFTLYQRAPAALRAMMPEPSWFAYSLTGLTPQQPHEVEIEYPDDAERTVAIALREDAPLAYPVSSGFDTGGEFSLTDRMQSHSLLFWPRTASVRAVLMNVHDGRRAAVSRIRVFRLNGALPPFEVSSQLGRDFINWYEEGTNFFSLVGAPDVIRYEWRQEPNRIAVDRWIEAAHSAGATIVAPTAVVYSFALYPSQFNRIFSTPETDDLRRILLTAEKYKLRVIPEVHPRSDELDWPFATAPDPKPNLLVSHNGKTNFYQSDGKTRNVPPSFNPLHPRNQDWYVGMIGELVDRYKDSPALAGISLRLMSWANPSLNNFTSIEWGYDDLTLAMFQAETQVSPPRGLSLTAGNSSTSPALAQARFQWLTQDAREAWIAWRCKKIAELYRRIRDRVRLARPDLKVYSTVFYWRDDDSSLQTLREAGIDPALLGQIDGVVLINGIATYGRREPDPLFNQRRRDDLLRPETLSQLRGLDQSTAFLSSASYVEATEVVVPPERIGFPLSTKRTWISAAIVPAGAHFLERYAVPLAETDAWMLGDGGNGYSLGQPILRDWLREYRSLPAKRFQPRADGRDPVAVWTLDQDSGLLLYAVNRERYAMKIAIQFSGAADVVRLSTEEHVRLEANQLTLTLSPYQLITFKAPPGSKMVRVSQYPPAKEVARVNAQVTWLADLARKAEGDRLGLGLQQPQRSLLAQGSQLAGAALRRGHLWRARTLLEDSRLRAIYTQVGAQPPGLRNAVVN